MSMNNELQNLDTESKIEILQGLEIGQLADEQLKELLSLLNDPDKGLRNQITMMLSTSTDERIPKYLVEYVSSPDISTRNLAGELLVKLGNLSVESLLNYLIKIEGNYDDEKFIIDVLGLIGNVSAESQILKVLNRTNDKNVKLSCIEGLGNLMSEAAIEEITKCYEEDELYKATVIESLGKIGSKKAQDFMMEKYKSEDELTKFSIIESLGLIGDMNTFYFLLVELDKSEGPLVWVLIKSIKELKEKFQLDVPFDEKIKSAILNTIYEAQSEYKKAAIYLLGNFNDKEILTASITTIGEDPELDQVLRQKVLNNCKLAVQVFPKLLNMKLSNAGKILALIDDVISNIGKPITEILTGLSLRSFIDSLTNYLSDSDEETRSLATNLLFRIDPKTAVLFADQMLSDDNIWNRIRLIDNLAEIEDDSVIPVLKKLSEDNEIMVSKRASDLLSQRISIQN